MIWRALPNPQLAIGAVIFNHHYEAVLDCFYDPLSKVSFVLNYNWRFDYLLKLTAALLN